MQKLFNLAPIALMIVVAAGVLLHDTRIDKATAAAITMPAMLATYGAAHMLGGGDHIHVERVAFSNQSSIYHSNLPKITPRDDNKYVQLKKSPMSGGNDNTQLWPSV